MDKTEKKITTSLAITPDLLEKLREMAAEEHRSVSGMLEVILTEEIERRGDTSKS